VLGDGRVMRRQPEPVVGAIGADGRPGHKPRRWSTLRRPPDTNNPVVARGATRGSTVEKTQEDTWASSTGDYGELCLGASRVVVCKKVVAS
jgi:hypothetical protein